MNVTLESKQISEQIDRPWDEAYAYAADPTKMPEWAPGLGTAVTEVDGEWYVDTPSGRASVVFTPRNDYGVLDHYVRMPTGEVFYNPLRVFANEEGCEVVFTLRKTPDMSDEEFEHDATFVAADLARLKLVLERERDE